MDYSLLAPGPVNIHPEVCKALSLPMIHHRTPEFDKILARVLNNLKPIFGTKEDVYLMSSTGSGGMEALIVNTINNGDKVLVINSGKFGERWGQIAKTYGAQVSEITVPWGEAVHVSDVEAFLRENPDTKAVLCQACETSTAVSHPIWELGKAIYKYPETLFLVDGITALGAMPLPMDQWHIDGLVGGSQKAFMLPTGLTLFSFSQKAWNAINQCKTPRYYFDVRLEKKANQNGETFFSSNISLIRALDVVLNLIAEKGLNQLYHEIQRRADFTRFITKKMNLEIYAKSPSNSVTAIKMPTHIDSQKVRSILEQKYNITIMGGQDQAKGKIIRIGHMGYIQNHEMLKLVDSLLKALVELDGSLYTQKQIEEINREADIWLKVHR